MKKLMPKTWTTREGERIEIRKMTDSHLLNTIRYLRRNAEAIRLGEAMTAYEFAESCGGDMAYDAAFQAGDEMFNWSDEQYLENREDYQEMLKVATRRGLNVNGKTI